MPSAPSPRSCTFASLARDVEADERLTDDRRTLLMRQIRAVRRSTLNGSPLFRLAANAALRAFCEAVSGGVDASCWRLIAGELNRLARADRWSPRYRGAPRRRLRSIPPTGYPSAGV